MWGLVWSWDDVNGLYSKSSSLWLPRHLGAGMKLLWTRWGSLLGPWRGIMGRRREKRSATPGRGSGCCSNGGMRPWWPTGSPPSLLPQLMGGSEEQNTSVPWSFQNRCTSQFTLCAHLPISQSLCLSKYTFSHHGESQLVEKVLGQHAIDFVTERLDIWLSQQLSLSEIGYPFRQSHCMWGAVHILSRNTNVVQMISVQIIFLTCSIVWIVQAAWDGMGCDTLQGLVLPPL